MSSELLPTDKHELLEQIAQNIPGLIYINDMNSMKNIWINNAASHLLGYSPEEIAAMGNQFYVENIHPEDKPIFVDSVQFFHHHPNAQWRGTYRVKHKNGDWKWFTAIGSVFKKNNDGTPALILGIMFDVTERMPTDERLERLLKENKTLKREVIFLKLSSQEKKITEMLLLGHSTQEISNQLFISPLTVKTHRRNIYKKLNINSIDELRS